MGHQTGAGAKVVMGFQSNISTIATAGVILAVNSCTVKPSRNQNAAATIRGNLNPVEPYDGNTSVAGDLVVPVDSEQFWQLLKAAFGSPTTTGASSPFTHVFKAGAARSFFTLEYQFLELATVKYFQCIGCKINSIAISGGGDGEAVATFGIIGASRTIASASFDAAAAQSGFARLKNNQLTLKEGGSAIANAKLVSLNIGFNCDTSNYVIGGGGVLGSIPDGVMSVTGNLDALFEDTTLLEKAENSTESSVELTYTASATSALKLLLPELKYSLSDPGIEGPQGISISLPFSAYYENATEETSVVATLTNTEEHA